MPTHVHIGTGKFGLGFCGHFSNKLKLNTVFLNRIPNTATSKQRNEKLQKQRGYVIDYYDTKTNEAITFDRLEFFDTEGPDPSISLLSNRDTILLTTTVGAAQLSKVAPIIGRALQVRSADHPLFIIACENGDRCSDQLKSQINEYLGNSTHAGVFVNCVVDQICFDINQKGEGIVVIAEHHREWIIEDGQELLKKHLTAENAKGISFVPADSLRFYQKRKLWLVNGFHLALAILGAQKVTTTRIAEILQDPELQEHIAGIQRELVYALECEPDCKMTQNELNDYISQTRNRFMASPDTCGRILRDALFSSQRVEQLTRDFAYDLGRNMPLSEVFARRLYECVFGFFMKVENRLYEPTSRNLKNKMLSVNLPMVLVQLIPFLVNQGRQLPIPANTSLSPKQ